LGIYLLVTFFVLLHHEPWRDEAQIWLTARDTNLSTLIGRMSYEGSPGLWYLLVFPLAKIGLPYFSESILHLLIAAAAVYIFLKYAPFEKITKILFVFSYFMAFEYAIVARSYGLSVLLLFMIAAFYHKRFSRPILFAFFVFLLLNTNVHSFLISGPIIALYFWDIIKNKKINRSTLTALSIIVLGGILSLLQFWPAHDSFSAGFINAFNFTAPLGAIRKAYFPIISQPFTVFFTTLALIIFSISFAFFIKRLPVLVMLLASYLGLFFIFTFKYSGNLRHYGFILIMLLFALWISPAYREQQYRWLNNKKELDKIFNFLNSNRLIAIILNFILFFSFLAAIYVQGLEYKFPFSGAKEMANYLNVNGLTNKTIVAHRSGQASALLPYLPNKKFWYDETENFVR
jgi:hypothetical protein